MLAKDTWLGPVLLMVQGYMWFDHRVWWFQVMKEKRHVFAAFKQRGYLAGSMPYKMGLDSVISIACVLRVAEKETYRFVTCMVFDHVSEAVLNSQLYLSRKS